MSSQPPVLNCQASPPTKPSSLARPWVGAGWLALISAVLNVVSLILEHRADDYMTWARVLGLVVLVAVTIGLFDGSKEARWLALILAVAGVAMLAAMGPGLRIARSYGAILFYAAAAMLMVAWLLVLDSRVSRPKCICGFVLFSLAQVLLLAAMLSQSEIMRRHPRPPAATTRYSHNSPQFFHVDRSR